MYIDRVRAPKEVNLYAFTSRLLAFSFKRLPVCTTNLPVIFIVYRQLGGYDNLSVFRILCMRGVTASCAARLSFRTVALSVDHP